MCVSRVCEFTTDEIRSPDLNALVLLRGTPHRGSPIGSRSRVRGNSQRAWQGGRATISERLAGFPEWDDSARSTDGGAETSGRRQRTLAALLRNGVRRQRREARDHEPNALAAPLRSHATDCTEGGGGKRAPLSAERSPRWGCGDDGEADVTDARLPRNRGISCRFGCSDSAPGVIPRDPTLDDPTSPATKLQREERREKPDFLNFSTYSTFFRSCVCCPQGHCFIIPYPWLPLAHQAVLRGREASSA